MLITRAQQLDGTLVDIRLGRTIQEVGPRLRAQPGEDVFDAQLGTVLPGLHDHHVHLRAAAAALTSVSVGPPQVRGRSALRHALHGAVLDADGWIRAVGYHDSVAGELNRTLLDDVAPSVPVRVQHRSGALWVMNSVALERIGGSDHRDGRFFRQDPAIPRSTDAPPSLRVLSERLTALGVTGVTDATPGYTHTDVETFSRARVSGELQQQLHCMALAGTPATDEVTVGPAKIIIDDVALDLDELSTWIADNHDVGHPVAVHAVTDTQLMVTLAALHDVGTHAGDRIEHAAVVPEYCIQELVDLRVTVVTQPNFVAERGDEYLTDVPAAQHDQLWRVASLLSAGVPVALSTDTPFGDGDPWAAMRAAVRRRTPRGVILGPDERISAQTALTAFLGRAQDPGTPRRIAVGEPGDVCVLAAEPAQLLADLDGSAVVATVVAGRLVYGS